MNTEDTTTDQTDRSLVGIRGWLILPAIGLALSPIVAVITLITSLGSIGKMIDRGYGLYSVLHLLTYVGILVYLCFTAHTFFQKRKNAPQNVIRLLITLVVASVILFLIGLAVIGAHDGLIILSLLRSNNFIAQGIAAAIWIPYFKISKRVKATFVN